jgi:hypothetical protein
MNRAARRVGLALVACCLVRAIPGNGAPAAPLAVAVVANGCGRGLPEVRELPERLAVELAPVRVDPEAELVLQVATNCTDVEQLTLRPRGSAARTRPVSLADVAPALRAVALAVLTAEFLRSSWSNPGAPDNEAPPLPGSAAPEPPPSPESTASFALPEPALPAPASSAAPPVPPESKLAAAPPAHPAVDHGASGLSGPVRRWELGADGLLRWFSHPASLLLGGELSLNRVPWLVSINVAAGSAVGVVSRASPPGGFLGSVAFGVAALSGGARLPFARTGSARWYGVGLGEVGFTWGSAASAGSNVMVGSTWAAFLALMIGPELDVPLSRRLDLTLGIRGGVARGLSITADGRAIAGTQGMALASSAGLRFAP